MGRWGWWWPLRPASPWSLPRSITSAGSAWGVLVPTLLHVWRTYQLWHGVIPVSERRAQITFITWAPVVWLACLFLLGGLKAVITHVFGEPEPLEGLGNLKRVLLWAGAAYYLGMATLKYSYKLSWPMLWQESKRRVSRRRGQGG
jgi:hypothetical protein